MNNRKSLLDLFLILGMGTLLIAGGPIYMGVIRENAQTRQARFEKRRDNLPTTINLYDTNKDLTLDYNELLRLSEDYNFQPKKTTNYSKSP